MSTVERVEVERLSLPLHSPFVTALRRATSADSVVVRVTLGRGNASATVWTCDFSHDYVRINADYRS